MIVIGIDPGLTGAAAVLDHNRLLDVADLPTCPNGLESGKMLNWLDAKALAEILRDWSHRFEFGKESVHAVIERPIAMPSQQVHTTASSFDTLGALRAAVTILGYPLKLVTPNEWKRFYGLSTDKSEARQTARALYPNAPVTRAKDHNRAEAVLIARYGLRTMF